MEKYTHELINKLNVSLQSVSLEESDIFFKATQAINLLETAFSSLKTYISAYVFKNESEEISFFKEMKPHVNGN